MEDLENDLDKLRKVWKDTCESVPNSGGGVEKWKTEVKVKGQCRGGCEGKGARTGVSGGAE